jgi:hypothetical protein
VILLRPSHKSLVAIFGVSITAFIMRKGNSEHLDHEQPTGRAHGLAALPLKVW